MFLSFVARLLDFRDRVLGNTSKEEEKYSGVRDNIEQQDKISLVESKPEPKSTFVEFDDVIENLCGLGKIDIKTLEPQQKTDKS